MSLGDVLLTLSGALTSRTSKTFFYANSYAISRAEEDPAFAAAMGKADIVHCDGFGVYLASRLLGGSVPERFTWPDCLDQLGDVCRDRGASMFFLGAREGVAAEAARRLERQVPGLTVHSHHGHFDKDDASSREVIDVINRSGASVLLVGLGMPLQEIWITRYREELKPLVVVSVGALFDYAAGNLVRGPRFLTQFGFEWLSRLVVEPRRLWRRYLIGLPEFALLIARQKISRRPALGSESQ